MTSTRAHYDGQVIEPMHEAHDAARTAEIAESIGVHGWQGEPVLVAEVPNGLQALTGSHRLSACATLRIEPTIHLCKMPRMLDLASTTDSDDVLAALRDQGADAESIRIMQAEVDGE